MSRNVKPCRKQRFCVDQSSATRNRHDGARLHPLVQLIAFVIALQLTQSSDVAAKRFGEYSCYKKICWLVPSRETLEKNIGTHFVASASWYDIAERDRYNKPGLTSSGETFDPDSLDRASSPNLPNGTKVLLWSEESKQAAYAIINNTGPFLGDRAIDVPVGLARAMGFEQQGVAELSLVIVAAPSPDEVRYGKNRRYNFDGGLLGRFDTLKEAVVNLPSSSAIKHLKATEPKFLNFGRKLRPSIVPRREGKSIRVSRANKSLRDPQANWLATVFYTHH